MSKNIKSTIASSISAAVTAGGGYLIIIANPGVGIIGSIVFGAGMSGCINGIK